MSIALYGAIALGGACGAVSRYGLSSLLTRMVGHSFPYGTMGVNIVGSLLMGVLVGVLAKWLPQSQGQLHALLAIGFLGSFTTFSTFSLDVVTLMQRGEYAPMFVYVVSSVVLSVAALLAGLWVIRLA